MGFTREVKAAWQFVLSLSRSSRDSLFPGNAPICFCTQDIWHVQAGFGMTSIDPFWHPRKQNMFDVGRIAQGEDDNIRKRLAVVLRTHLQKAAGLCLSDACQVQHVCHPICLEVLCLACG